MLSFFRINRSIRSLRRLRVILAVLVKYGFGHLLEQLNIRYVPFRGTLWRPLSQEVEALLPPQRMRLVLEELGPTFIKLGQLLSTRPDVVPRSFANEFSRLQDKVPSFPYELVRRQVRLELGGDIEDFFCSFDEEPLAAASIAQVHRARMCGGEEVVVKVRRPDIIEIVDTDIDVLAGIASWVERHVPSTRLYDPVGVVREFSHVIRREMDLAREGHTIEKFAQNFAGDPTLYFPTVYWEATAGGVLTMEYINGIKVSDLAAIEAAGLDRRLIASRGANIFLKMLLRHGFFHGDPHPGNVYILPDNVICLLDYGMVGRLDRQMKDFVTDLLVNIINRDVDHIISLLVGEGEVAENLNIRGLRRDLSEFIDSYYEVPLADISIGKMLLDFIEIITTYHIKLEPDLMLLCKALVNIEGMGRDLDPGFDMVRHMRPLIDDIIREKVSPEHLLSQIRSYLASTLHLFRHLPRDLREIFNRINRDKFKIDLEHRGLDRLITELDRSTNRLSSSLIIAALIVGSSILVHSRKGPFFLDVPAFALFGFIVAAIMGLWLVIGIFRSGRL